MNAARPAAAPTETVAGAPHVRVTDLVAGYLPNVDILRGCSIEASDGELVGIIGPNGAGKSTLLKGIFGLVPVRSGAVEIAGTDVTGAKADRLVASGMAFVPQTDNVFTPMTVRENLELGTHLSPKRFAERYDKLVATLPELGAMSRKRAGGLSGGERQLVAMARALMSEPSVLLLDEPSAGLSPVKQDETFLRIHDIRSSGVCVIMVEQNARRCLQVCDRAYVLEQGRDAHTGTGEALLHDPKIIELYLGDLADRVDGADDRGDAAGA
ncbi:ABC transporter ATP-binding protein [Agromyces rhizosphaerae]|uniref:ABC transporter ATP-binding protein n=1 Tax=Agromyces rhizosphaerae TaxID=88374 RepID=A0A9W6CUP2_9MICO|nr:ABC transporter ATP-binding protein [Agromyces rhizosphaerae]GLI26772.1 ABC transporter ATP-binding protein [Agromyces rhizosphaerae]